MSVRALMAQSRSMTMTYGRTTAVHGKKAKANETFSAVSGYSGQDADEEKLTDPAEKEYCELEQYRTPLELALEVIRKHSGCNYVADTRDGFEDNPLDTIWVANYFMPKAKEYGCRIIYFIIDENNSLKDELEGQEKDSSGILEFRYINGLEEV